MKRTGFTIVEVLITMVILTVLLTLGVVSLRGIQANGRDAERKADVESIAIGLEQRYKRGNPVATANAPDALQGSYPGINEALHIGGSQRAGYVPDQVVGGYRTQAYPGTTAASFINPGGSLAFVIACVWACAPAGNSAQLVSAFNGKDSYVYEPVNAAGNLCCCGNCVSYNLYWISETDSTPVKGIPGLQIVKSKHR